jgi:hypothetical protein
MRLAAAAFALPFGVIAWWALTQAAAVLNGVAAHLTVLPR